MSRHPHWRPIFALTVGVVICCAMPALAFEDSFDLELGSGDGESGQSGLNYDDFASWTVSSGTVDLIASGDYGIDCADNLGKCVDLDGATGDAGILTSAPISLGPGTYHLSFELAGVADVFGSAAATDPNVVDVSVGDYFMAQITREHGDPFETFGGQIVVNEPTVVQIAFANQGGDNFGALLDNVRLMPEPSALALVSFSGLILLAFPRQRRGMAGR